MVRGVRNLLVGACLTATSCTATHDVKIRAIANPAEQVGGGSLLGQARGELALGNVGLALESFRKLQREQPDSVEAFAGIAACYAAMARYDLARANYEYALAYAPRDPALLRALASTLEHLDETEQAAQVRAEAARLAAPVKVAGEPQVPTTVLGVPRLASVTVQLPKATPSVSRSSPAPARLSAPLAVQTQPAPVADNRTPRPVLLQAEPINFHAAAPAKVDGLAMKSDLAMSNPAAPGIPPAQRAPKPAPQLPIAGESARTPNAGVAAEASPHLERTSPGEVSLVTTHRSAEFAQLERTPHLSKVQDRIAPAESPSNPTLPKAPVLAAIAPRWVPLRFASPMGEVRLLNAARSQGLAARTRSALLDHGWRRVAVGDAPGVRQHSLVLYSPVRVHAGRRLAAQLHCKALESRAIRGVVALLGRDAARTRTSART